MKPIPLATATLYPETKPQLLAMLFRYFHSEIPAGVLANTPAGEAYLNGRWDDFVTD